MRHNKFTLVELLVVICIASLLMGVVLPAFNRMVTGSAVDRLASNLKLRLARAQSEAVASRRDVALILPNGAAPSFGTHLSSAEWNNARLGGSRMCYVTISNYSGTFTAWVPDETWNMPERGASLIYAGNDPANIVAKGSPQPFGAGVSKPVPVASVIATPISPHDEKPLKDITHGGHTISNSAIIFSPKGNVRSLRDVYLVVAETMQNGNTLVFPGGDAYNFRALKINHLTGNVEYFR